MTMQEQERDILCGLMRDHEDMVGSTRAAMLALQALISSVRELRCPQDRIKREITELVDVIRNTQPKIIPLIHLLIEFEDEMAGQMTGDLETVKTRAIATLQKGHDKLKDKIDKIMRLGLDCIEDDDVLVLHTASPDVTEMIAMAKTEAGRKIKVVVLKQDIVKTRTLLAILEKARVDLEIVPEFSLSHYIGRSNKMFTGALSITPDNRAVSAAGTANIASLCHFHKIPVYMFANTLKFAHGGSEEQQIHEKKVPYKENDKTFTLTTYSHDMVDLGLVDFLVTEEGIFPREKITDYIARVQERGRHR